MFLSGHIHELHSHLHHQLVTPSALSPWLNAISSPKTFCFTSTPHVDLPWVYAAAVPPMTSFSASFGIAIFIRVLLASSEDSPFSRHNISEAILKAIPLPPLMAVEASLIPPAEDATSPTANTESLLCEEDTNSPSGDTFTNPLPSSVSGGSISVAGVAPRLALITRSADNRVPSSSKTRCLASIPLSVELSSVLITRLSNTTPTP